MTAQSRVRLFCPRGHFIATVRVYDVGDGLRVTPVYPPGRGDFLDVYQHDRASGDTLHKVKVACGNRRCGYSGRLLYVTLVTEIAETVAAGGGEHRLTT